MAPEEPAVKGLGVLLLTEEGGPRPQEVREEATLGRGGVLLGLPRRQAHTRYRLREGPLTVPRALVTASWAAGTERLTLVAHGCTSHSCGARKPEVRVPAWRGLVTPLLGFAGGRHLTSPSHGRGPTESSS